jgi:hypothetical protein
MHDIFGRNYNAFIIILGSKRTWKGVNVMCFDPYLCMMEITQMNIFYKMCTLWNMTSNLCLRNQDQTSLWHFLIQSHHKSENFIEHGNMMTKHIKIQKELHNLKTNGYWALKAFKINIPKNYGIKKHFQTNIC